MKDENPLNDYPALPHKPEPFKIPYPGWKPYCLVCSSMARMVDRPFGYHCEACGNDINFDMTHHNP